MAVPKYDEMFNPLLQALRNLGGSASIPEQEDEVASLLKLSEADLAEIHRGNRTKFSYRLAWARNYLKRFGLLDNSSRGVWALTATGHDKTAVDKNEVAQILPNDVVELWCCGANVSSSTILPPPRSHASESNFSTG